MSMAIALCLIMSKKELASRDVVSRRMIQRIREGKGVKSAYGRAFVA